jgi:hypothetical protein
MRVQRDAVVILVVLCLAICIAFVWSGFQVKKARTALREQRTVTISPNPGTLPQKPEEGSAASISIQLKEQVKEIEVEAEKFGVHVYGMPIETSKETIERLRRNPKLARAVRETVDSGVLVRFLKMRTETSYITADAIVLNLNDSDQKLIGFLKNGK